LCYGGLNHRSCYEHLYQLPTTKGPDLIGNIDHD